MRIFLTIVLLNIIIGGCNTSNNDNFIQKVSLQPTEEYSSHYIHRHIQLFPFGFWVLQIENEAQFYYFSRLDTSMYIKSLIDSEVIDRIKLQPLFDSLKISLNDLYGFYMPNSKEIWMKFYNYDNKFYNIFSFYPLKVNEFTFDNETFTASSFFGNITIGRITDSLFVAPLISNNTDENHIRYPFGIFKIHEDEVSLINKAGYFPANYKAKNMHDNINHITKISNDSILVSFLYNDTVDLYVKERLEKRIVLRSDSSKEFLGFNGSEYDINAIKEFNLSTQRYERLIYDKNNQLYYRIFTFNAQKTKKGKIEMSQVWSFNIFDTNFNKVGEQFFNSMDYDKFNIFIYDKSIFLINYSLSVFGKNMSDSSKITFQKFNLIENEKHN